MLTTILSLLGGGLVRAIPELIGLWNKKTDNAHELAMLTGQTKLEELKGANQQHAIESQGQIDQVLALLEANKAAVSGQMQKVGIKFVDALNFLVRPLVTYYFVGLYGLIKSVMLYVAFHQADRWAAVIACWTPDDAGILAGILGFWFVGRVFDKKQ
jgi:hypothetical protein